MRIGISTSVIDRGRTGIGQYLLALIRAFEPHASRNQFILYVLEEDLPLFARVRHLMELVPVAETHRPAMANILWHQRVLPQLARIHQLDVLHVPSYRRMLWRRPCALVATIHDLAPFRIAAKYDWKRMLYGRVIARRLAWRQQAIIAISQTTAADIRSFYGLPAERVTVIHNGVEHERFSPAPPGIARAVAVQRFQLDAPFLLYVARLEHPGKNHVRLIRAFSRFKATTRSPWQLVLAGTNAHGAEVICEAIRLSPYANAIRCLGFVSDEDLPMLYRAAEVFVYPSLYEGFGMPPIEAMASGCPVLASTRGALGEIVGNAAATVDPENEVELEQQLTRLASDETLRAQLRAAGLEHARHFDWNQSAARTLDVYTRAARSVTTRQSRHLVGQMSHR